MIRNEAYSAQRHLSPVTLACDSCERGGFAISWWRIMRSMRRGNLPNDSFSAYRDPTTVQWRQMYQMTEGAYIINQVASWRLVVSLLILTVTCVIEVAGVLGVRARDVGVCSQGRRARERSELSAP